LNFLGVDVAGVDAEAFFRTARNLYPFLALGWLLVSIRVRRPWFLVLGVLLACGYVFLATHWPLQSLYGLLTSNDRVGNLALVQVVAAGNSPIRTAQAGQLHFEPFWGLLVAVSSGFDPDRVLVLYPFFPLVMMWGFALALYAGLRPDPRDPNPTDLAWSPWERALAAAFALLLSSAPFEYAGTYRVPWAMTFLLKPNHALGFVLAPLVMAAFARIRGWQGRLAVGFLLHLLGWVFVIHMAFFATGLVLFAASAIFEGRVERKRDVTDALSVIGVNVAVVSPYLVMLLVGYPFLHGNPRAMIPPFSPHLLEASLKHGAIFGLGVWGAIVAWRRGDRLGRVFVTQLAAGYLIWAGFLLMSLIQLAKERDEIYYWIRFFTAAAAGLGAWDLVSRVARTLPLEPARRAALVLALAVPWSLPYWWDPLTMDSYIPGSLQPVPERLRAPTAFIRESTDRRAIFAGDSEYARFVSALGARRVSRADNLIQTSDHLARFELERRLVADADPAAALALAKQQGVTHLLVTPRLLALHQDAWAAQGQRAPLRRADLEARGHLSRLYVWSGAGGDFVAIYKVGAS